MLGLFSEGRDGAGGWGQCVVISLQVTVPSAPQHLNLCLCDCCLGRWIVRSACTTSWSSGSRLFLSQVLGCLSGTVTPFSGSTLTAPQVWQQLLTWSITAGWVPSKLGTPAPPAKTIDWTPQLYQVVLTSHNDGPGHSLEALPIHCGAVWDQLCWN